MTDRKEQILQAGSQLIREQGFPSMGMRALAREVGIEAPSLYAHFSSKEHILAVIADRCAKDFEASLEKVLQERGTPIDKLQWMITSHLLVLLRNQNDAAVFISEWRHLAEPTREAYAARRTNYEHSFRQAFVEAVRAGQARAVDVKLAIRLVFAALNSASNWYRPAGKLSPEDFAKQLTDQVLYGLVKPGINNN